MSISLFEAWGVRFELSSEEEIANISVPGPKLKKIRTLYFFSFQSLRTQSDFSFLIHGPGAEIWPFSHLSLLSY